MTPSAVTKLIGRARSRRVDIRAILADPRRRREMMIAWLIATQAREGIETTREQAEAAIDKVRQENDMPSERARRIVRRPRKPARQPRAI
jgi:hypothetical protein